MPVLFSGRAFAKGMEKPNYGKRGRSRLKGVIVGNEVRGDRGWEKGRSLVMSGGAIVVGKEGDRKGLGESDR